MPTAVDFEIAATSLADAAEDVARLVGTCSPYLGPDVVNGGALAELVEITLAVSDQNLREASTSLDSLAALCRQRAAICRAYDNELLSYQRELNRWIDQRASLPPGEVVPARPNPPPAPPPWVSHR